MAKKIKCFLLLCTVCTGCAGPTLLYYDPANHNKFVISQHHWLINLEAIVDQAYSACASRKMKPRFIRRDLGCNSPFCLEPYDQIYFDCEAETNLIATPPGIKLQIESVDDAVTDNKLTTKCKDLGFEQSSQKFTECLKRISQ